LPLNTLVTCASAPSYCAACATMCLIKNSTRHWSMRSVTQ
jgi:hypothetical protein